MLQVLGVQGGPGAAAGSAPLLQLGLLARGGLQAATPTLGQCRGPIPAPARRGGRCRLYRPGCGCLGEGRSPEPAAGPGVAGERERLWGAALGVSLGAGGGCPGTHPGEAGFGAGPRSPRQLSPCHPVQAVPGEVSPQDGYVLLLALLSIFIGGTLVLLSGILIVCRRCCEADRRHSRCGWATGTGDAAVRGVCGTLSGTRGGPARVTADPPLPAEPAMTLRKPTPPTWTTRSQPRVSATVGPEVLPWPASDYPPVRPAAPPAAPPAPRWG